MHKTPFIILLLFQGVVFGQENFKTYNNSLKTGYPNVLKQFFDLYGLIKPKEVQTTQLETGIDTLQVYFGTAKNEKNDFYWSALTNNDSLLILSAGFLLTEVSPNIFEGKSELELGGKRPERIKFSLRYNKSLNSLTYNWLNDANNSIDNMKVFKIEKFKLGSDFPNLTMKKLRGEKVDLSQFQGKVVVLNWWHTRCGPCIAEMPGLNKLANNYSKNENVVFVSIADNTGKEILKFLQKRKFNYVQFTTTEQTKAFLEKSYPIHLIIGTDNKIKFYLRGGGRETYKEIDTALKKLEL